MDLDLECQQKPVESFYQEEEQKVEENFQLKK